MSTIACLAMNPALDVSTATEAVLPTHKLRCDPPKFEAGGGGVNVARAICALGGEAIAVFPAGGASAEILTGLLDRQSVPHRRVHIRGATRESLTVDERRSGKQFRFVLPGPRLTSRERQTWRRWRTCGRTRNTSWQAAVCRLVSRRVFSGR
jgi:6-phosphofructokinase 2